MEFIGIEQKKEQLTIVWLVEDGQDLAALGLDKEQLAYVTSKRQVTPEAKRSRFLAINLYSHWLVLLFPDTKKTGSALSESYRQDGVQLQQWAHSHQIEQLQCSGSPEGVDRLMATLEGLALANYQFLPYFSEPDAKKFTLQQVWVIGLPDGKLKELQVIKEAVYRTRDLVNEPLSALTAPKLADEIVEMTKKVGIEVEILDKARIEALKMGGLLAVNKGSIDPPRFCIMDYKPENAVNEKPLILVGKGIVYDTGGLSLKPTPNSMDHMKSDMAGAAAVVGVMYAIAALNWPVRVVALVPTTDNRPDGNAYVPGDIIQMHNGLFVEVLNTDAEGRMILADALSYAKKYDPELVIDIATLTGSAQVAVGSIGTVAMGTAGVHPMSRLKTAGEAAHERVVEFPLWEEYGKMLETEVADIKNIGGREAGAITAGKFLEKFTDYPWIHLDIAGPSFLFAKDGYRTIGGTGTGVRLLLEFIRNTYIKSEEQ